MALTFSFLIGSIGPFWASKRPLGPILEAGPGLFAKQITGLQGPLGPYIIGPAALLLGLMCFYIGPAAQYKGP